ncbi:Sodium/solute symporter [Nitrospina gracilis 3/211]|uniref:Sodium/solute symporter n=1 Tax=Nitrospina gracilis (strain 3/211) TaxID=1266370 RepID=M1Z8W5_NITG3|nr:MULTISPECIES: sodium:solute symporter family protein [Nitrospina]MCF8722603.1 SSS family solute:Na+ symporter/sodium/pantothenate symporter [Nitrospina sp. Nb-3]CCQ89533.1 Sodium/solute symporter [Nitrospina gracilis 3/211]
MTELPFGPGALLVVAIYILSLLGIGWYAYSRRKENSLNDFFLGGREMGFLVLVLTLYATQYSGNTLFGFSGAAYREGLRFLVCVHFMTAIVIAYLIFAPRLHRLSRDHQFITPGDYVYHRFGSHALRIAVTLIMVYVLCNFTLAQMKTLGTAFAGISQGRIPMWVGVVGLALIMLVYESLGGMRSVAWTDVIQGGILMTGFVILLFLAFGQLGSLTEALNTLAAHPETRFKVEPPTAEGARTWLSFILMVGLGAAIYPQALQRIYAAKNSGALKRSLAAMGFMPLLTTVIAVSVGILMAAHYPDIDRLFLAETGEAVVPSETVLALLCREVMLASALGYWLVVFIFAAILAAVMSTADSALLSISSMITQDLYGQYVRPDATQEHLTRIGKILTWVLMVPITGLALGYEGTLIQLLKVKFDLLLQCVPAFYMGVHTTRLGARAVMTGLLAGSALAMGLNFAGDLGLADANHPKVWGIHSGVLGMTLNLVICFGAHAVSKKIQPSGQ